jgi:hypothetical protein
VESGPIVPSAAVQRKWLPRPGRREHCHARIEAPQVVLQSIREYAARRTSQLWGDLVPRRPPIPRHESASISTSSLSTGRLTGSPRAAPSSIQAAFKPPCPRALPGQKCASTAPLHSASPANGERRTSSRRSCSAPASGRFLTSASPADLCGARDRARGICNGGRKTWPVTQVLSVCLGCESTRLAAFGLNCGLIEWSPTPGRVGHCGGTASSPKRGSAVVGVEASADVDLSQHLTGTLRSSAKLLSRMHDPHPALPPAGRFESTPKPRSQGRSREACRMRSAPRLPRSCRRQCRATERRSARAFPEGCRAFRSQGQRKAPLLAGRFCRLPGLPRRACRRK